MTNNPALGGILMQLVQRLNPEFLQANGDLINQFITELKNTEEEDGKSIKLEEYGLESPEELLDLVNVVPKYNELLDELEDLDNAYQELQKTLATSANENQVLRKELGQVAAQQKKYVQLVHKAKQSITVLQTRLRKAENENNKLKLDLQAKQHLLEQVQLLRQPTTALPA